MNIGFLGSFSERKEKKTEVHRSNMVAGVLQGWGIDWTLKYTGAKELANQPNMDDWYGVLNSMQCS